MSTRRPSALSASLVGAFVGLVVAVSLCGTLATLILIENHLRNMVELAHRDQRASSKVNA